MQMEMTALNSARHSLSLSCSLQTGSISIASQTAQIEGHSCKFPLSKCRSHSGGVKGWRYCKPIARVASRQDEEEEEEESLITLTRCSRSLQHFRCMPQSLAILLTLPETRHSPVLRDHRREVVTRSRPLLVYMLQRVEIYVQDWQRISLREYLWP